MTITFATLLFFLVLTCQAFNYHGGCAINRFFHIVDMEKKKFPFFESYPSFQTNKDCTFRIQNSNNNIHRSITY